MSITGFITCLICASALTLVAATSKGQTALDKKVTISIKDQSLENAFEQLAKAASVSIAYGDNQALEDHLSINATDEKLGAVLDRLLFSRPFSYVSIDDKIIIRFTPDKPKKEKTDPPPGVTGKVVDEKGEPLPGATIRVKGTDITTVTDKQGRYRLQTLPPGTVLIISFVGYESQEVPVVMGSDLFIGLQLASSKLDEVIIIPYGTTTQRLNTGSITKITAKEIESQPISNPLAALEGRVPGLIVTQQNGVPGSNFKVQLEGRNNILTGVNSNSDPLFIIDGVPFAPNNNVISQLSSAASPVSGMGLSPFNTINPSDIESIEVLKDADATAIYGSRGAYGVILITTKKGKAGKTAIDASVYSGFSKVTRTVDLLNTQQYLQMRKEAFANDGVTPDATSAPDLVSWDQNKYMDWKKFLIGNTAHSTDAQLSVSGGSTTTQFLISGNYHRETTVLPGDNADKRANVHFSISHSSENKRFTIALTGGFTSDVNNILTSDLTSQIFLPPNYPDLTDNAGNLVWQYNGNALPLDNLLAYTKSSYEATTENLTSNLTASYTIFNGLSLKLNSGYSNIRINEQSLFPKTAQNPAFSPLGYSTFGNNAYKGWIVEPQLEYNTAISKGKLNVLVGNSYQAVTNNSNYLFTYGYTSDNLLQSNGAATSLTATNAYSLYHYTAFFGRINYNWDEKYIINLSGRRDGSSRFGTGKQFGNFGAVGAAWIFTSEPFLNKNLSFLSYGKLRASYGTTGSDQIGDYQFLDTWRSTANPYAGVSGLYPAKLVNNSFGWEVNNKLSIGIDLGFLQDRFLLSTAYFDNRSSNHLINSTLPTQTGFTSIIENFPATIQNSGWEFSLNMQNISGKKFKWTTNFNLTLPKNKLLAFPGIENSTYNSAFIVGQPLNIIRGNELTGVNPATGVYDFKDLNGDGVINANDREIIATLDPKFYGGILNSFTMGGFSVDLFFEFRKQVAPNYLYSLYSGGNSPGMLTNVPLDVLGRWQKAGDVTTIQKFTANYGTPASNAASLVSFSSGAYSDASFIRFKTASLNYNFPGVLLNKLSLKAFRVYLRGQNLLTFTYYKGGDPETQSYYTLPPLRTIVAGIQLSL